MTSQGVLQIAVYFIALLALTKPLGAYMATVYEGKRTLLHRILRPLERIVYKVGGVKETEEQRWTQYTASLLAFSLVSFVLVYAILIGGLSDQSPLCLIVHTVFFSSAGLMALPCRNLSLST